jgi:hypothetical protein
LDPHGHRRRGETAADAHQPQPGDAAGRVPRRRRRRRALARPGQPEPRQEPR